MPVIHTYASTPIPEAARDALKTVYGSAIEAVPGKTEQWLMCLFEGDVPIYHAGDGDAVVGEIDPSVHVSIPPMGKGYRSRESCSRTASRVSGLSRKPHAPVAQASKE